MSKNKLFRETPFNGYNRDDVLEYMREQDEKLSAAEAEARNAKEDAENYLSELENLKEGVTVAGEEKGAEPNGDLLEIFEDLKKENARLKQEIDNRDGMLAVFDDMQAEKQGDLSSQCEKLKVELLEKEKTIELLRADVVSKEDIINSFQKEILLAMEKFTSFEEEMKSSIESVAESTSEQNATEVDEILRSARIKSEYMLKNAEYIAYTTKERLLSLRKSIDTAICEIEKSLDEAEKAEE